MNGVNFTFLPSFLSQVALYHQSLTRPSEIFQNKAENDTELSLLHSLASLPREECPHCHGRKQVYCGSCQGLRLPSSSLLLPPRIPLPFTVLLLTHWQESLHKCTGIHAAVLAEEGSVEVLEWPRNRIDDSFLNMIRSLDADNDVLLFPSENAIEAKEFPWNLNSNSLGDRDNEGKGARRKRRLIVLEASWTHGK